MRAMENLGVSARYLRMRFLESVLAVLGTTVGVAVITIAVALVQTTEKMAAAELASPTYRMMDVIPQASERRPDVPITRAGDSDVEPPKLSLSDLEGVRAECSSVDYAFAMVREQVPVGDIKGSFQTTTTAGSSMGRGSSGGATQFSYFTMKGEAARSPESKSPSTSTPSLSDSTTLSPLLDSFELVRATEEVFPAFTLSLAEGSLYTRADGDRGNPVVVLGADIATQMFGDSETVGGRFKAGGVVYTVLGVLNRVSYAGAPKNDPNRMAFAPYTRPAITMGGRTIRPPTTVAALTMAVRDAASLKAAVSQVESYFTRHFGRDAFTVRSYFAEVGKMKNDFERLFVVIGFLAAGALLISSINLFNMLTIRVARRTRGIGVMRSFGANRGDVFRVFLGESILISVIGGLVGVAVAPVFFRLLSGILIPAGFGSSADAGADWRVMALCLVGATVLNTLFASIPAWRASATRIVEAIRAD